MSDDLNVVASMVSKTTIKYECPICYTKYKKNGEPYKRAKHKIHTHGNETRTLGNRITTRTPHCDRNHNPYTRNVYIHITDATNRE